MRTALKTRIADAMNPELREPPGWDMINYIMRTDPRLSGDNSGIAVEVMSAAIAALSGCRSAEEVAGLPARFRRVLLTSVWSEEHKLFESACLINYVEQCLARQPLKPVDVRRIARGLLFTWRPDVKQFRLILNVLDKRAAEVGGPIADMQAWGAFKPEAPEFLARVALQHTEQTISDTLGGYGLSQAQSRAGFVRETFRQICKRVAARPDHYTYERLLDFALDDPSQDVALRFEGCRDVLASACLSPWHSSDPERSLKTRLLDFMRETYGDVRFTADGTNWTQVADADKRVMRRWLAGESLQMFLDVVGETAEAHMWRYRRAFWENCFDRGIIDDAWVVFGSDARRIVLQRQESGRVAQRLAFGRLEGANASQSVLLMKVGECTLVEWSHNGKIWLLDPVPGHRTPKLHVTGSYNAADCRGFDGWKRFETSHTSPTTWNWQGKVARELKKMTGERFTRGETMP